MSQVPSDGEYDTPRGRDSDLRDYRRRHWDGRGAPPSKKQAIEWMVAHGVSKVDAEKQLRSAKKDAWGALARRLVDLRKPKAAPTAAPTTTTAQPDRPADAETYDVNADGVTDSRDVIAQVAAGGGEPGGSANDIAAAIAAGPQGGGASERVPLWPYAGDTTGITVEDRSAIPGTVNGVRPENGRVGARYFEDSTLVPLTWSAERRADLQRVMYEIGLYGDQATKLGTWDVQDQAAFAEVLRASNVEGLRWAETIAQWRQTPPTALLAQIKSSAPKKPTIQVTNPMDIRQAAQTTSQRLLGEADRPALEGVVKPYQGAEAAAQRGVYADQEGGGGGAVTQAPSVDAFVEDKLRREHPIEVDGYQFLNQFDSFLSMIGAR